MSILDRFFHQRHVAAIQHYVRRRELEEAFDAKRSAIYRVPLPGARSIEIDTIGGGEPIRFRRGLLELIGLGRRVYVLDSNPLALFDKPIAVFIFAAFATAPRHVLHGKGHVRINDGTFPMFDAAALKRLAVHNRAAVPTFAPPPVPVEGLSVLRGRFPPTDLPNPNGATPPANGTPPAAGTGVLLFYGLCFQNPRGGTTANNPIDQLWPQTSAIAQAFAAMGFRTWTGVAGPPVPGQAAANANAKTPADLMSAFAADLSTQTTFCNSTDDQLVILVSAHGHGADPANGPPETSFHFDTGDGSHGEYLSQREFGDALGALSAIANGAGKTYLIMYACRSGLFFDLKLPGALQGMHVITATPSGNELTYNAFGPLLFQALGDCDGSWQNFLEWLKHRSAEFRNREPGLRFPFPRNGDVLGCRMTIVLRSVAYGGADIGDDWRYAVTVDTDNSDVAEHVVALGATDTLGRVVYDRFRGSCNAPVPAMTGSANAIEVDVGGFDPDDISPSSTLSIPATPCDGTTRSQTVVVQVAENGSTAVMTFTFDVTARCTP